MQGAQDAVRAENKIKYITGFTAGVFVCLFCEKGLSL